MIPTSAVAGQAALTILDSLLLALSDRRILPDREISGILQDAAAAHANAPETDDTPGHHAAVAALIRKIITARVSVLRP